MADAVVSREAEAETGRPPQVETAADAALRAGFRPSAKMWAYLAAVVVMYASGIGYALLHNLSVKSLFLYGLLQPPGVTGEAVRLTEIETPLSWNLPEVIWFIYIKASAVLVELFQYWAVGMLIAGALIVFVSWEAVKRKMGFGGLKANLQATAAGAVIPICSCGIVPVLAGMVEAGIPLGPTMAFLIAAPMLNVPTVFMTAGVLGWRLAAARIIATFGIALAVGQVLSSWQRRHRNPRRFLKIHIPPRLSPELRQFAFKFGIQAANAPAGVEIGDLEPGADRKLMALEEAGIVERMPNDKWKLVEIDPGTASNVGACAVLPAGDHAWGGMGERLREMVRTAARLFIQLNGYLVLAVIIAGAIKVVLPTSLVTQWVGGTALNSVLLASVIAVLAYVCTYVEVPTALALVSRGMGPGATLAYLLGGPGLSLPSIAMLSGVFKARVLALYVGVSFIGCIVAGYLFNLLA